MLHGTLKALEVVVERGATKKPLVARFGGIELRWQKHTILSDEPQGGVQSVRSEVVQRLLAQKCELCGVLETGPFFQVHHVRKLADLDRPGRRAKNRSGSNGWLPAAARHWPACRTLP